MLKIFKKKKWYKKEFKTALRYIRKLFSLKVIKIGIFVIIILVVSPIAIFLHYKPETQQEINYGANFSKKYAAELGLNWRDAYIKILDDLGTKNIRLVAYWDNIERERDVYDFSDIEWQLDEAEKRNINVMMTIGRKVPRYPECFEPEWWNNIEDISIRDQELFEYIKTSVNTLKKYKSINFWQIENEPFFPFGECKHPIAYLTVKKEMNIVKSIDDRPTLTQDSGEGGYWLPSYSIGDYLAISMYRKIWYDFWGVFAGYFIYFKYPLAHWTYAIKAGIARVPYQKIIVTELQGEPWGPAINSTLSEEEKNKTMSRRDFISTISYAQKAGFKDLYFWGVEWWLWEKEVNNNPFYWNTAKAIMN